LAKPEAQTNDKPKAANKTAVAIVEARGAL
jgi:hypothetical protein